MTNAIQERPRYEGYEHQVLYTGPSYHAFGRDLQVLGFREGFKKLIEDSAIEDFGRTLKGLELTPIPYTEPVTPALGVYPGKDYCLDFDGIDFLSSSAIGKMLRFNREHIESRNVNLGIVRMIPGIYEIFEITRMNKGFDIKDSIEKLLASPRNPGNRNFAKLNC